VLGGPDAPIVRRPGHPVDEPPDPEAEREGEGPERVLRPVAFPLGPRPLAAMLEFPAAAAGAGIVAPDLHLETPGSRVERRGILPPAPRRTTAGRSPAFRPPARGARLLGVPADAHDVPQRHGDGHRPDAGNEDARLLDDVVGE